MTPRKRYRSDLTEAQWQRIKGLLPRAQATGRPRCDEREAINGILYVLSWKPLMALGLGNGSVNPNAKYSSTEERGQKNG
jgi:hypothetical protein